MLNRSENVLQQYSGDKNLSARIKLHAKHSTNKKGFYPWLFEIYQFTDNDSILELGCGNGMQWSGKTSELPIGSNLILSDFSEGMVDAAKENLSPYPSNISFRQIDIQDIPFVDESFDVVIANHMLYHVPDMDKALSEVRRVLKIGGRFYAATGCNGGIRQFLHDAIKKFVPGSDAFSQGLSFNMQNGKEILNRYFPHVKRHDYVDSLAITETQDLMDWMESSMLITSYPNEISSELYDYFEKIRITEGSINIPKSACLFVCAKL